MNREKPLVSVVIPMLNEEDVIDATFREVIQVLDGVTEAYEIIVVDDGSEDRTFAAVEEAHRVNPRVKGLKLSKRFGKEAAILAGLARARGKAVVTMDGDLQHPPALIPVMIEKWREGAQIVHGVKQTRNYGGYFHRTASRAFNTLFSRITGFSIANSSDFKLLDARVARLLVQGFPEQQRFHRGLSSWVGFRQESLQFQVAERPAGQSQWSVYALFRYAWNTVTSYTSLPLQFVPVLGLVMLAATVLLGTEAVISRLNGHAISGFATLEITILFSGSIIMIGLGIIGQYLARVYDEVKKRPVFVVADELGFELASQIVEGEA
jgi:glycosyltransferase involved in cell wall biosynthesis